MLLIVVPKAGVAEGLHQGHSRDEAEWGSRGNQTHVVRAVEVFSIYSVSFNPLDGFIKCRYKYCYKLINLIVVARLST